MLNAVPALQAASQEMVRSKILARTSPALVKRTWLNGAASDQCRERNKNLTHTPTKIGG